MLTSLLPLLAASGLDGDRPRLATATRTARWTSWLERERERVSTGQLMGFTWDAQSANESVWLPQKETISVSGHPRHVKKHKPCLSTLGRSPRESTSSLTTRQDARYLIHVKDLDLGKHGLLFHRSKQFFDDSRRRAMERESVCVRIYSKKPERFSRSRIRPHMIT